MLELPLPLLLDPRAWVVGSEEWMGELFEWEGSTIWGLTGRILADLLPRLRQALGSQRSSIRPPNDAGEEG